MTFKWWILAASTVDYTLTARPEHLDAVDVMGISSWGVDDVMGTSSSWRATVNVGATPATSALAS
jgi:hypothetical protein